MQKLYAFIGALLLSSIIHAQCSIQISCLPVTCYGSCDGMAGANVNGVPPFTFMWLPGGQTTQSITGLCAGTYTCTMTDANGCVASATCQVTSPPQLSVAICSYQNPSCQSCCDGFASACASGGTAAYTYNWTPCMQTSVTAQALCIGTQTVCVTDANGCSSCTTVTLSSPTGVEENEISLTMTAYADVNGSYLLSATFANPEPGEILVTDVLGQVVLTKGFDATSELNETVDLSAQASGLYFISVHAGDKIVTQQVIKN